MARSGYKPTGKKANEAKHKRIKELLAAGNMTKELALCSNLAMPYGKVVSSFLPSLDAYAWSYEVGAIKLESQIYQYLIDKLQCHAKDILFIGDTLFVDYSDPNEFGMSARLIDRKNGQKLADVLIDIL